MRTGNLFVLSGPSGAGKGTLIGLLLKRLEGAWLSVSATTRAPREGEVDGVSYLFVSDDRFDEMVAQDRLLEWAQVHDHRYGTPRDLVERHIAAGDQVFLEIDVQGALQVRSKFPAAHLVFIAPPSMEELERRLRGRGTDSEESIRLSLANAEGELRLKEEYDECFVNDDVDACLASLVAYVERFSEKKEEDRL